jgi:hypothetical protein
VRWCGDLNQRRGGGAYQPPTEALNDSRPNEGRGTPLSRSERAIACGAHNTGDLELRRLGAPATWSSTGMTSSSIDGMR